METKAEIKKVVLKINDKEISLTVEEAKKLKELLGTLFGGDIIKIEKEKEYIPYPQPYPVPYYPRPYWDYPKENIRFAVCADIEH